MKMITTKVELSSLVKTMIEAEEAVKDIRAAARFLSSGRPKGPFTDAEVTTALKAHGYERRRSGDFVKDFNSFLAEAPRSEAESDAYINGDESKGYATTSENVKRKINHYRGTAKLVRDVRASYEP